MMKSASVLFIGIFVVAFLANDAQAQPVGEITSVIARVNGNPGTDFQPGDEIRVDAEGWASVPAGWGTSESITLVAMIQNPSTEDIVGAGNDIKTVLEGTGNLFETINEAKYNVPNMNCNNFYVGYVDLYYYSGMTLVLLDTEVTVPFTTD